MLKSIPRIIMSQRQIIKLSDIFADMGMVFAASVALPSLFGNFNSINAVVGMAVSVCFCFISLLLSK